MKSTSTFLLLLLAVVHVAIAQEDDLLKGLENEQPKQREYVQSTFKGTRLINGHTIESVGKNTLEFRVGHRFDEVATGEQAFWGLDNAHMNLTFDYSYDGRLSFIIGRNSFQKLYEGAVKYRLLRQTTNNTIPISATVLTKGNLLSNTQGAQYDDPINQLSYFSELLLARKFSPKFSLQFSPSFIHFNLAEATLTTNNIFAASLSARYKISKSIAVTGEYTQTLNDYYDKSQAQYIPVASIGLDIETGGHVFQLFFTNASALNEVQYIPFTTSDWGRNGFRFGFNISRNFAFGSKSSTKNY